MLAADQICSVNTLKAVFYTYSPTSGNSGYAERLQQPTNTTKRERELQFELHDGDPFTLERPLFAPQNEESFYPRRGISVPSTDDTNMMFEQSVSAPRALYSVARSTRVATVLQEQQFQLSVDNYLELIIPSLSLSLSVRINCVNKRSLVEQSSFMYSVLYLLFVSYLRRVNEFTAHLVLSGQWNRIARCECTGRLALQTAKTS